MRTRRLTLSAVAFGGALMLTGTVEMVTAHAAATPGSGFGSLNQTALGTAIRFIGYSHTGEDAEAQVPASSAMLSSGGQGDGLSSVFWPGGTGGAAGSTLAVAGDNPACGPVSAIVPLPTCPPVPQPVRQQYHYLNDPVKAEAQTGTGNPTQTMDVAGGAIHMTATATGTNVHALATVVGSKSIGIGTFGNSQTAASTKLTGPKTAVSDASGSVQNVALAAGAIKIGSVSSVAHAVTNGKTATGSAKTLVNDVTVAGIPVTVDQQGVHVKETGSSLSSAVAQVNKAFAQSGIKVFLTAPTHQTQGGNTTWSAGNLIIAFEQPGYTSQANDQGTVVSLGGASVTADAAPGFSFKAPKIPALPSTAPTAATAPTTGGTGSTGAGLTGGTGGSLTTTTSGKGAAPVVSGPDGGTQAAAQHTGLTNGLWPGWIVLALLGAGIVAAGLRRLPDQVLAGTATTCPLGDD